MIAPGITILFEGGRRTFEPGDLLTAEYRIDSLVPIEIKALEASVMWYTAGKGDEDLAVHHFVRHTPDDALVDFRRPQSLRTLLPIGPLSYDGAILKVRWCVRVRMFPLRGRETVSEELFQLGRVPQAVVRKPPEPVVEEEP